MSDKAAGAKPVTSEATPAAGALAVLIVGMHRSGTSALSGVLNLLGVAVPEDLHPADQHNERGYFESQTFIDFHERLLARIGSPSDDPLPLSEDWTRSPVAPAAATELAGLLADEMAGRPLVLFKDPRMCRLLPVWRDALAALACPAVAVIPCRAPLEVAGSLAAKADVPRPHGLMLWLQHVIAGERATRGMRRSFLGYDELMSDWRGAVAKLERELGLVWPRDLVRAADDIDRFLTDDLRHQGRARQGLTDEGLEALCGEAWSHLEGLRRNPDDARAMAGLDAIAVRAAQPMELFGPLVVSYQQRLARTSDDLLSARGERDVLAASLAETVEGRDRVLAEKEALIRSLIDDRARAIAERDKVILDIVAERDRAINDGHRMLAEERAQLAAALAERDQAHAAGRAEASRRAAAARRETLAAQGRASAHERARGAAEAEVVRLQGELEAERAAHAASREAHAASRGALEAILASTTWRAMAPVRALVDTLRGRRDSGPPPAPMPAEAPPSAASTLPPGLGPASTTRTGQRILFVSGEAHTPGHFYRVLRPLASAARVGAIPSWVRQEDLAEHLDAVRQADILYLWRTPYGDDVHAAVEAAKAHGAKVVFDVDDMMVDPSLARIEVIDGIRSQQMSEEGIAGHFARIRHTMSVADLCVGATEELAQRMREACLPALVLPNAFDHATLAASRTAARARRAAADDGLVRLGYASGSRTHQRDFAQCADAVAAVLRAHSECRLVLFKAPDGPVLFIDEFSQFEGLEDQIEWRDMVPLDRLPAEMARFDINLAPLEVGNPFCEAKSELKFFEAALVDVVTVASPCGPFRRAIRDGEAGLLAEGAAGWREALERLVGDAGLRRAMAAEARRDVLWRFGPERHQVLFGAVLDLLAGGRSAAQAFELKVLEAQVPPAPAPRVPDHVVVFEAENPAAGPAAVSVAIPLYNYAHHIEEALESVAAQMLPALALIVVDDRSTDDSLPVAVAWARVNADRFARISVLQNAKNEGLAFTRNVAFETADTPYVLTLDADNRLLPDCASACLETIEASGAAFAYPIIRQFGDREGLMGAAPYDPVRLSFGNYIDAMALIAKAAWAAVGGYDHIRGGWEDFDFWCRLAERGLRGEQVPGEPLAEYRVHETSMISSAAAKADTIRRMMDELEARHPWLTLIWPLKEGTRHPQGAAPAQGETEAAPATAARRTRSRRAALQNS